MSTAHQLARALGARRSGRQYVCRCPAHDDAAPSLIFWQGHSAIRFKCYAGCEPEDVIAALRRRGLLEDRGPGRGPPILTPGVKPVPIGAEEEWERARKLGLAERIWRQGFDITGTAGEAHLARRGIALEAVPNFGGLRWHRNARGEATTSRHALSDASPTQSPTSRAGFGGDQSTGESRSR